MEIRVKEELIGRIILRHPQEYIKSYKKTLFGKIGVDKLAKDRGGSRWSFARLKVGRGQNEYGIVQSLGSLYDRFQ